MGKSQFQAYFRDAPQIANWVLWHFWGGFAILGPVIGGGFFRFRRNSGVFWIFNPNL